LAFTSVFSQNAGVRIAFGEFELDGRRRLLSREGELVPLAPKPMALLELLIERRPEAVSKEELVEAIWEGAAISDTALTTVVNELRRALGESGRESRFVRTAHGYGYAFEGEVRTIADAAGPIRGWLLGIRVQIPLAEGETVLGRAPGGPGTIVDPSVSRRHALVRAGAASVSIEDLGSRNGTTVRGVPVSGAVTIENGDEVGIGLVVLRFLAGDLDGESETPAFRIDSPST